MPGDVVRASDAECDEGSSRERAGGISVHLAAGTGQGATQRLVAEPVVQREHEGHGRRIVDGDDARDDASRAESHERADDAEQLVDSGRRGTAELQLDRTTR